MCLTLSKGAPDRTVRFIVMHAVMKAASVSGKLSKAVCKLLCLHITQLAEFQRSKSGRIGYPAIAG